QILYFFCNISLDKIPLLVTIGSFHLGLFSVPAPLINLAHSRKTSGVFASCLFQSLPSSYHNWYGTCETYCTYSPVASGLSLHASQSIVVHRNRFSDIHCDRRRGLARIPRSDWTRNRRERPIGHDVEHN